MGLAIDGANRNDHKMMQQTLTCLPARRPEPTEDRPQGLCLDKGYDFDSVRELAKESSLPKSSASRCTCGRAARRRRLSRRKRTTECAAGWSSALTVG